MDPFNLSIKCYASWQLAQDIRTSRRLENGGGCHGAFQFSKLSGPLGVSMATYCLSPVRLFVLSVGCLTNAMAPLGAGPSFQVGIPVFLDPQTGDRNKVGAYLDQPTRCHSVSFEPVSRTSPGSLQRRRRPSSLKYCRQPMMVCVRKHIVAVDMDPASTYDGIHKLPGR
jgi:hypothetical protein